ncbi:peroxiredoxin [Candidatus Saccharibacteria bacterium]|jgi:peroxiredoxin Q/BCP|nr:peroxiredoxin [Candidatus Saccharibacteria bacterium]
MLSKTISSQPTLSHNKVDTLSNKAPSFSLLDHLGEQHDLEDYRGSWLIVYFYPKNDTPGCTTEACSIRDVRIELEGVDTKVIGISPDDRSSHQQFIKKYDLNFTLLSDDDAVTTKAYGAWGQNQRGSEGVLRKTFIINPNGDISKSYDNVTPDGHGEEIITDLVELQRFR